MKILRINQRRKRLPRGSFDLFLEFVDCAVQPRSPKILITIIAIIFIAKENTNNTLHKNYNLRNKIVNEGFRKLSSNNIIM